MVKKTNQCWLKKLGKELTNQENIVRYILPALIVSFAAILISNMIAGQPKISMICKDVGQEKNIVFNNQGKRAGENIYLHIYSDINCRLAFSVLESNRHTKDYKNSSWYIAPKDKAPYLVEAEYNKGEWETGREFSLLCPLNSKIMAIIGGDNIKTTIMKC